MKRIIILFVSILYISCSDNSDGIPADEPEQPDQPISEIYQLPLVVHVLHDGENIGEGTNISDERIQRQIEILNEDFRRKSGTRGFNDHPDGGDTEIEFILAKQDPEGNATTGILRKQLIIDDIPDTVPNFEYEKYAFFSYWNSEDYINVWVVSYPDDLTNIVLGKATGPDSDLGGDDLFEKPLPGGAEGIIINWAHFGESNIHGKHGLGRTLTHEMGHYLGLLHTWGGGDCETNDFCDDTPAVDEVVNADEPYIGCGGELVLVTNYMNYSSDAIMNIFTKDQIGRMRYILQNSARRNSLLSSKGLLDPE